LFNRQADLSVRERTRGGKLGNELLKHGTILSPGAPGSNRKLHGQAGEFP
jgi:hypothetical protein